MIDDLERQQLLCSENYCEVLKSSRVIGTCKMSDYPCNNGANRGHINIPPPPLPPNMQPYRINPGSAPPYGSMAEPNRFSNNPSMYPHPPSNQVNFFSPPPSPAFNAATSPLPPPPTPHHHHLHPPPYFSAPPPFPVPPTFQPEILPSSSHQIPNAEENNVDKIWIRNWLERRRKPNKTLSGEEKDVSGSTKISDVKAKVLKIWKLIQELESQSKSLMIMMKTLNEEQWRTRVAEIEVKKLALVELLDEFENKRELLMDVKRKLLKRSRKRNREKKRRAERRIEQTERRIACEKENKRIDLWLKEKEEEVERTRREEEMKREADNVLSGVTRRKNEAKRQLALLEGLRKLHKARVVARNAMGLVTSTTQLETFSTVIDRLTAMWNCRLDNYHMEEHGLKVMLNESNAEDKASVANRHKLILRQWETALFGSATNLPQDKESFLANRKDWDSFVVHGEDSVMSSSIPVGWIIPCEPSSEEWRRLLHVHKQKSIMKIGEEALIFFIPIKKINA